MGNTGRLKNKKFRNRLSAFSVPTAAGPAASLMDPAQPVGPLQADAFGLDSILTWFRGEFAAANAIIDALCRHMTQIHGGGEKRSEYEAVFAAIHRRRLNWIPVLQMQLYHSISEVEVELRKVAEQKKEKMIRIEQRNDEIPGSEEDDSPKSDITDSGSNVASETIKLCSNHDQCILRPSQFKLRNGFSAMEQHKGQKVNVVKGLKLYEDIFTETEISKLIDFANEVRAAGRDGKLSGDTFILFNKQMRGNKQELIQFGVPIFGNIKEDQGSNIKPKPIPAILQHVIDHLVQWKVIPESRKPNGCVINFCDEDEHSQPFHKPPHWEQPVSTLLLSDSTLDFGGNLMSGKQGNYRGSLTLSLKQGSLLVMRKSSANIAKHVMCPSANPRVIITFFKICLDSNQGQCPPTSPQAGAMTLWQPGVPATYAMPNGPLNSYQAADMMSKCGGFCAPLVMTAPVRPMVMSLKGVPQGGTGTGVFLQQVSQSGTGVFLNRLPQCGTGVFLPWNTAKSRKPAKRLPPHAQKGRRRLLAFPSRTKNHY